MHKYNVGETLYIMARSGDVVRVSVVSHVGKNEYELNTWVRVHKDGHLVGSCSRMETAMGVFVSPCPEVYLMRMGDRLYDTHPLAQEPLKDEVLTESMVKENPSDAHLRFAPYLHDARRLFREMFGDVALKGKPIEWEGLSVRSIPFLDADEPMTTKELVGEGMEELAELVEEFHNFTTYSALDVFIMAVMGYGKNYVTQWEANRV